MVRYICFVCNYHCSCCPQFCPLPATAMALRALKRQQVQKRHGHFPGPNISTVDRYLEDHPTDHNWLVTGVITHL